MKKLFFFTSIAFFLLLVIDSKAREIIKLTSISFKGSMFCGQENKCFQISPDSKGLVVVNPQSQLYYLDAQTGARSKIADTQCSNRSCFSISGDLSTVAFPKNITLHNDLRVGVFLASLRPKKNKLEILTTPRSQLLGILAAADTRESLSELNFCGSKTSLYARMNHGNGQNSLYGFNLETSLSPKINVFNQVGGRIHKMHCALEEEGGLYFLASTQGTDTNLKQEIIYKVNGPISSSPHSNVIKPEIIFQLEAELEDSLIPSFRPLFNSTVAFFRQTPRWDRLNSMSGLLSNSTHAEDNKTLSVFSSVEERTDEIFGSGMGSVLFSTQNRDTSKKKLYAVPEVGGETIELESPGFALLEGTRIALSRENGRVLFSETGSEDSLPDSPEITQLVSSDIRGENKKILLRNLHPKPNLSVKILPDQFKTLSPKIESYELTPSGRCAIVVSRIEKAPHSRKIQLFIPEYDQNFEIMSSEKLMQNREVEFGGISVAPDSSYFVVLANLEKPNDFDLFKVPTPECKDSKEVKALSKISSL